MDSMTFDRHPVVGPALVWMTACGSSTSTKLAIGAAGRNDGVVHVLYAQSVDWNSSLHGLTAKLYASLY